MDLVALYAGAQARIVDLVSPLPAPDLARTVPGTPRWTVAQLVAHLAGVCDDVTAGRVEGAATEPWTSRQVAAREGRSLQENLVEWQEKTPALVTLLATPGLADATAFDIMTHEHDLRGALGRPGASDPVAIAGVTDRVTGRLNHLVTKNRLPGLRVVCDNPSDGEWVCGDEEVAVVGRAPGMEWFRALFGRRSAAQVLTYEWEGDPAPYFEIMSLFGPLPAVDVMEAGAPLPAPR